MNNNSPIYDDELIENAYVPELGEIKRLLIIDDDEISRMILNELLSGTYEIIEAHHGKVGIEIAKKQDIDLILLDINMPDMNGFEVCTFLKNQEETENIPIIFLTAKTGTEDKTKAFMLGAADYITKPFESDEMLARIETHLKLKENMLTLTRYNNILNKMLKDQTRELIRTERHALFSVMIKGIVHNLRNPLNAMLGANELIKKNSERAQSLKSKDDVLQALRKIDRFSDMIKRSVSNLNEMIDSMMAKSRQDNKEELEVVDLVDIIRKEIDFMMADSRFKKYIDGNLQLPNEKLMVEIIPSEIAQIFQNLISNAFDALHNRTDASIRIEVGKKDKRCYFKVEDNGPGIPDELKKKIFHPFFTTKDYDENSDRPPGTGLGLYMSNEIISKYKGEIILRSRSEDRSDSDSEEQSTGACFKIYLPLYK